MGPIKDLIPWLIIVAGGVGAYYMIVLSMAILDWFHKEEKE